MMQIHDFMKKVANTKKSPVKQLKVDHQKVLGRSIVIPRLTHIGDKNQHLSDYNNQLRSIAMLWLCGQSQETIRGSTWTLVSKFWKLAPKGWTWPDILASCYHESYDAVHGSCHSFYLKARGHSVFNTSRQLHKACGWSVGAWVALCEEAMHSSHVLEDSTNIGQVGLETFNQKWTSVSNPLPADTITCLMLNKKHRKHENTRDPDLGIHIKLDCVYCPVARLKCFPSFRL